MARYNPKNRGHRKSLATRIAKMLVSSGFSLDATAKGEDVYERPVDGTTARVRVLTSIINGEMRQKDKDAIRVCAVLDTNGSTRGLVKSTRINRTGDTDAITSRLLTAMRKTYKIAQKRANDPGFLALPATPSKKRRDPYAKRVGSKRNTMVKARACRLNAAVRQSAAAAEEAKKAARTATFTNGMLVCHMDDDTNTPGLVREIDEKLHRISIFWLNTQSARWEWPTSIRALTA
tara:strand:- start:242 stop:943 length:702 start_codon:yes stop_codon:yes gene_type:complete